MTPDPRKRLAMIMHPTGRLTRSTEIAATTPPTTGTDGWTITARAVPYNTTTEIFPGLTEEIRAGAITPIEQGPLLFRDHDKPIGRITQMRDEDDGLVIDAVISDTPLGDETRQLISDGVLTRMSIGFRPAEDGLDIQERDDGSVHVTVTRAELYEVSVVAFPAYADTPITDQRTAHTIERNPMATDAIDALEDAIDTAHTDIAALRDRIDGIETRDREAPAEHPLAAYTSLGDYAKRAPAGLRFRDAVKSDASVQPPIWLGRIQARMAAKQRVTNALTHTTNLPSQGTSIAYSVYKEDDLKFESYTEGTRVATGGMKDEEKTATIESFAGGTQITRKTLTRADPAFISNLLERQAIKCAKKIEAWNVQLVREQILAVAAKQSVGGLTKADAITADSLRDTIIDAQQKFDDSDQYVIDGLFLTWDLIKSIAKLGEEKRLLRWVGSDSAVANEGKIDPTAPISLSLYGVPVVPLPGETLACFYDKRAIVVRDDGEAPLRLQQDQVLDLRRDTAVYSECVHYSPFPGALLPWTFNQG